MTNDELRDIIHVNIMGYNGEGYWTIGKAIQSFRESIIDECKEALENRGGYVCDVLTSGYLDQLKQGAKQ